MIPSAMKQTGKRPGRMVAGKEIIHFFLFFIQQYLYYFCVSKHFKIYCSINLQLKIYIPKKYTI